MLTGQNGILNRTAEAKEKTEIANEDEQRKLAQAEALMNTEKTTYKGVTLPEGFAPTKIKSTMIVTTNAISVIPLLFAFFLILKCTPFNFHSKA